MLIFLLIDITDKIKSINQLKEIDQYKDLFLATVTHDLKTPLNSILAQVQISLNQVSKSKYDKIEDNLNIIFSNCQLLQSMIWDILDLSQIKVGKLRLNKKIFLLSQIVSDVEQLFLPQLQMKNIDLRCEYK